MPANVTALNSKTNDRLISGDKRYRAASHPYRIARRGRGNCVPRKEAYHSLVRKRIGVDMADGSGIYMILNKRTGRYYIGSAVCLVKRKSQHWTNLRRNCHANPKLQASWNKHGADVFEFLVLEKVTDISSLIEREQYFIDFYKATNAQFGYNLRAIANSNLGIKFSLKTRAKVRALLTGRKQSPETIKKRADAMRGRSKSPQHVRNIIAGKIGLKRPDVRQWAPEKLAKFNAEQVDLIRRDRAAGATLRALAAKYGCSSATIHYVSKRRGLRYASI